MPRSSSKGSSSSSSGSSSKDSGSEGTTTTIPRPGSPQLLFDLPESIYTVVARFLRVKQALQVTSTCARLHLPQASQTWYFHDKLRLNWHPGLHGSTLAALLGRFQIVTTIDAGYDQIIYPLAMASSLGFCKNLCKLEIGGLTTGGGGGRVMGEVSIHALDCLGTAIGAGSLPALQKLEITHDFEKGGVQALLRGFWNGASPSLHSLDVSIIYTDELGGSDAEEGDYYRDYETNENETRKNVEALAVMLDKRRRLGCCVGPKELPDGWMEYGSVSAKMRILHSTLGTLEELNIGDEVFDDKSCKLLADLMESETVVLPQMKELGFYRAFVGTRGAAQVFHAMGKATAFNSVL